MSHFHTAPDGLPPELVWWPTSCTGKRRLKPRLKPKSMMTEEEKRLYKEYLTKVRTESAKRGGLASRGKHKRSDNGRTAGFTSVFVLREDHDALLRYAMHRSVAIREIVHEFVEDLRRANPQVFAGDEAGAPQQG